MRFEFSAGGVVYKKDPSRSSGQNQVLILVAQHSQHHGWVFPKGLIGDTIQGEKKEQTALREVREETGIEGKIIAELDPVTYWFSFKNEKIKKTVYYYVMELVGENIEHRDKEMEQVEWTPIDKVLEKLTYKSDKEVFKQARPMIEELVGS